ncbi:MAG: ABC transporter permease [Bacteroidales bacterium]|nr:ABC transporter permease [Bacteroidales bacterium]
MFRNYVKVAFRNLIKYRIHSIINILGLSIGIAISILILILVQDEISYDKYNDNWKRIYRINRLAEMDGTHFDGALTPLALKEKLLVEVPEIELATRLIRGSHKRVSYENTHLSAENFYYADESFFRIFSIPLLKGDPSTVLSDSLTIVLTESTANKYFGEDDPIGKILDLDNDLSFRITGICEDVPGNSHFHFDYLASLMWIEKAYEKECWLAEITTTYILAEQESSKDNIEAYFPGIVEENILANLDSYMSERAITFTDDDSFEFYLQPISEIHLNSLEEGEFETGTDKVYIYVFTFIALLILIVACVNFMNLSTAKSATRAKEVALRKIVGASPRQLIFQFLSESVFFSFMALFLSLVVLELLLRPLNIYLDKNLDIFYLDNWYLVPGFIFGAFIIGILSGSYPAFYLSSFKVVNILKGRNFHGMRSTRLRGFLVLLQFTISIILFISSMIIYQQVKFFRESNLGFNQQNVVVVQRAYALQEKREAFKEILLKHPDINAASVSTAIPGRTFEQFPFHIDTLDVEHLVYLRPVMADFDFMRTMQMHLLEGNFYNSNDAACYNSLLINEAAAREIGFEDPVGMKLSGIGMMGDEMDYTIQGIVKDFHFESLHNEIKPLAITLLPEKSHAQFLSVRISGDKMTESLAYIEKVWKKFVKNEPFDFYFLNKDLDALYNEEETTANIFAIFSFLAIFIAALGLFGMASHTAEQKTREIGIRKALGASMPKITMMLSAQFTKWVIWAILIAFPVAYAGMKLWLGKFAYQINMEAWFFFLAAILALVIALVTVSYQAYLSASASPVEALQYE